MKRAHLLALACLAALPALAHDMWLVPPDRATVGQPTAVDVAVGMDFPHSIEAIDPARLEVSVMGPKGQAPVAVLTPGQKADGKDTVPTRATFTPTAPGAWLVAATTKPNQIELEANKFNDYLLHDGLPHVLADRMDRGELNQKAKERYRKCVKCVVRAGDGDDTTAALRVVQHPLEIVPVVDPLAVKPGGTLRARVLFRGEPLPHANLCWDHPGNGEDFTGQTWTDARGEALVPVARKGPMTLRLIHMTRPQTKDYEWESFWASYTFRVE